MTLRILPLPQPEDRYNVRWASNLIRDLDRIFQTMIKGDREVQGKLITLAGRRVQVTSVSSDHAVLQNQEVIDVNSTGATVELTLPGSPGRGERHQVQDSGGNASNFAISVTPSTGVNLNGSTSSVTVATDYGRKTVIFNGTQWIIA